ncbi:MFS transporter [Paracidovorax anthurii]|uniref:YNFM family putative membrane transporter n=1 Tax=Paracidovorax anthurii TaxID=78229 RepID=A0A328YJH8_9BURK|nr:MFS transporter [Paracidovorax anthurii]RAR72945.1 YNFM family putative membrane transporter [Paracidovorax anthurii]
MPADSTASSFASVPGPSREAAPSHSTPSASGGHPPGPAPAATWVRRGTPEYARAGLALFLLGFASFSLIYSVQPLLPAFAASFGIGPAESSLALSLTTGWLAVSIVLAGAFSQALGRRGLMFASMALAALLQIAAAAAPTWHGLLVARALEGWVLGGVPAVAMAWLAEEIEPASLGRAMGLYVGGTAFGAMMGRVGMGLLTEFTSWRVALGVLGGLCLISAVGFVLMLPRSSNFARRPGIDAAFHLRAWGGHLRNPALLRIYAIGFMLTSIFVTLFNYATFRLSAAPYGLGQTQVSLIFLAFGFGIVSSSVAGGLADRFGRRPLMVTGFVLMLAGVGLTLLSPLAAIVAGIALVTTGFFIGHSVASGSVGPLAGQAKGHAASLYLFSYYMGSAVTGSAGGWFWQHGGWWAIAGLTGGIALAGALSAARGRSPREGTA